jgi:hypothetical protein
MPYNPSVNDTSGQILAGYQNNASQITAAGNEALTKGIMDGVTNMAGGITGAYMQQKTLDAQGKAGKDLLKILAPAAGMDPTTEDFKNLMKLSNHEFAAMSPEIFKVMPSMVASNSWAPRAAMQRQNAVYQNQVPANQVPMSTTAPAAQPQGSHAAAPAQDWRQFVPNRQQ